MNKDALQLSIVFSDVARKAAIKTANAHSDAALAAAIAALPKALVYKGAVNYYADLPTEGVEVGHCYTVLYQGTSGTKKDGTEYAWGAYEGGYAWIPYGPDMEEIFAHIADGTIHVTAEDKAYWNGKADVKPYLSLERVSKYLYNVSFLTIPEDSNADVTPAGACSSFVRDGKLHTNLDWKYDEAATFHMTCPGFEGNAFLAGLTDTTLNDALIGQLPYHIRDGKNDHGIMVAAHVLYNDWEAQGTGAIPLTKLPYLVLTKVKSMATLETDLADVLNDLTIPAAMEAAEYLMQVLVSDGETTCVLRPLESSTLGYEVVDISENPKLTNFLWVQDATVVRADLQDRPNGVERWNMMPCALSDLRFTKAYEQPTRLSEFIGINGTTKDSTDAELEAVYDLAHARYLTRERDGTLWQTMHSAVYSPSGMEHLWVQEDWTQNGDTVGVVAPAYSENATYDKGNLVMHDMMLYEAKVDISTPEEWTPDHWEQTTVDGALAAYVKYGSIVVTCLTQDSVLVTGQTVTVRKGSDASGPVYATAPYEGQPVSFAVPIGFDYYVSVSDTLAHHFDPTVAHGVVNTSTINVTLTYSDFSTIRTFRDVKAALNADIDLTGLVGEQVKATRQNKDLMFDVVDYDAAGKSVWLLLHDTMPNQMTFEPSQALAWFENGLPAGAYYFTHSSKNYYFTLAQPIPENGQLKATTSTFSTYANQDASTAIESGSVSQTEIAGATSLGTTATGNLNHMDRVSYGSNNAGESGLFTWLNSDAEPNTNLPRINKLSRPYSSGSDGGFLRGFDPDALACLDEVTWQIQANNAYEAPAALGGITAKGQQYNITGKIGLAKFANVGLSGSNPWDLYVGATNTDRIKYYNGGARSWWVFDAYTNGAYSECNVDSSGGSSYHVAFNSYGVVPACKISKST